MVELILGGLVELGTKFSGTGKRKPIGDEAHPQMRLLVVGGPMVHIRDVYKTRRSEAAALNMLSLPSKCGKIAGDS